LTVIGANPVPLRAMSALGPTEELLAMVSWPVAAPAVVGSNCRFSVSACPGFRVTGKLAPESEKPAPVSVAELTVTGAVPVDVKVTDCVATVPSSTLPNATLLALMVKVGTAAFSFRTKLLEMLPDVAVSVTVCAVVTADTVAVNPALVALAGTVAVTGTETAALLLDRLTLRPPAGAADAKVTAQESVPDPVMELLLQEKPLNTGGAAMPVPYRPMTAVAPAEELLLMPS